MISVVIPFFRSGPYLGDAIESVLNQTEKDWELVLVDNNASENTRETAETYARQVPEKIRIVHESRQGPAFARNLGILESRGQFVALLDDDDIMYPERLFLQKKALDENPGAALVYGLKDDVSVDNADIIESSSRFGTFPHFQMCSPEMQEKTRLNFVDPNPSSVFFLRKKAIQSGLFDTHFSPFFLEDSDFNLRIHQCGDFIEIPRPILRSRTPSQEFLKKKREKAIFLYRLLQNQDYFYSKVYSLLEKKRLLDQPEVRQSLRKWRGRWLKEASFPFLSYADGNRFARLLLIRSFQENPSDPSVMKHLMRSFFSMEKRAKRYGDRHLSDERVPEEITERFLEGLFSGKHDCPFCMAEK